MNNNPTNPPDQIERLNSISSLLAFYGISSGQLGRLIGAPGAQIRRAATRGMGLGRRRWQQAAAALGVRPHELHNPDLLMDPKVVARLETHKRVFFAQSVSED